MGRTNRKKKHSRPSAPSTSEDAPPPKTFVIQRGKVGNSLNQLILNLRHVMEPNTATRLKVRQRNVLKDFVQVAGVLGVTHFIIVSRSDQFINLRVCRLPHGPTLTFHVNAFSLIKDIVSSQKDPVSTHLIYKTPPLLVQNGFSSSDKPSQLLSTVFQNLLPSLNVGTVKLADIRRCLLLQYQADSKILELRHYAIRVKPRGLSRGVRKLIKSRVPDLSKYHDISEYVLGDGASDSEGEEMGGDVTLPQDLPGRGNIQAQQSAVRLSELGPRLTLQLIKIEAGLCGREVLYHSFVQKSKSAVCALRKEKDEKRELKAQRKREQEENVARKLEEKARHKERCLARHKEKFLASMPGQRDLSGRDQEDPERSNDDDDDNDNDDDKEWYRQEVGEEPDPDTFVTSDGAKKSISLKLRRRMGKRQSKDDLTAPKAKRARQSHDTDPRRGKKREQLKTMVKSGTRGRPRTSKTGGSRVFKKKTGRK